MASFSVAYEFRKAVIEDATAITLLEDNSYPPDEAATPAKICYRIEHANDYFYILKKNHQLIGFINGTVIHEDTIHHESMSIHHPTGKTLVIHSVVVDKEYRRQKTASKMLQSYIQKIYELKSIDQILLLSKSNLLPFYLSNNFHFIKTSPVVHGQETWMELGIRLNEHYATPQWIVDAFASEPFTGNQAAVVLTHKDDDWMQKIATENNYAETSFVQHIEDNIFKLRWFTPAREVELCGHATLAAAHVLYETKTVPLTKPIRFQTVFSGELVATGNPDKTIELSFPSTPVTKVQLSEEETDYLLKAFGFKPDDILYTGKSIYDLLVEVTPDAFYSLATINHSLVGKLGGRGVLITTVGGKRTGRTEHHQYDIVTRGFFPLYGINEDPVTGKAMNAVSTVTVTDIILVGSAHCALSVYWFERFGIPQTADVRTVTLDAFQACPTRGGALKVSLLNDRTILGGKGITTMTAKILV